MNLNAQQKAAAEFTGQHALVLAGAGTGKTRTIIARAAHLLRSGVTANRILLLTFTRRAAREMITRLKHLTGTSVTGVMAGTFHHFCLSMIRRYASFFGEGATVIDRDDQEQLMKLARAECRDPKSKTAIPPARSIVSLFSYVRNTMQPPDQYLEKYGEYDEDTNRILLRVFTAYERRKAENRYLDFDDLLFQFAKVLHESKPARARIRKLFDHVLVDEMQDTNPLQWLILDGLRDPARLFCVGDDAQSIYAFRGADFKNVHSFTDRVPNAEILKLSENYRSTQEILNVANWLLGASALQYGKKLVAHRGSGQRPRLVEFDSEFSEADWITDDIKTRHDESGSWSDQMIITRSRSRHGFSPFAHRARNAFGGSTSYLLKDLPSGLLDEEIEAESSFDLFTITPWDRNR